VRKRVTVLRHESDFSDLAACTFWLPRAQTLSTNTMRAFATKPWANATVAFYPSTVGTEQWIRLDNAALATTPAVTIPGTACIEPGGGGSPSTTTPEATSIGVPVTLHTLGSDGAFGRQFKWPQGLTSQAVSAEHGRGRLVLPRHAPLLGHDYAAPAARSRVVRRVSRDASVEGGRG
jgi:hypothetical protein